MKPASGLRHGSLFLLAVGVLWLYFFGLGAIPFMDRTDSRYAEIAREMVVSGDYLRPTIFGHLHLHKPPVTYWFTALGFHLFGFNEWGARFFLGVFGVCCVLLVYLIAARLMDRQRALCSALLAALAPGLFIPARVLATDVFLLAFQLMGIYGAVRFLEVPRRRFRLLFWGAMGVAFLTKGPIGPLIPITILFVCALIRKDKRRLRPLFSWDGIAVFSIIALPWFLYLVTTEPGLLRYFLMDQILARVTDVHGVSVGHPKPFTYYFTVFPVLVLPFLVPVTAAVIARVHKPLNASETLLLSWLIVPILVFTPIRTKLPTYIILSIPAAAMLAADWLHRHPGWRGAGALAAGIIPILLLPLAARHLLNVVVAEAALRIVLWTGMAAMVFLLVDAWKPEARTTGFLLLWLVPYTLLISLVSQHPDTVGAVNRIVPSLSNLSGQRHPVVCYGRAFFQIPFYLHEMPVLCNMEAEPEAQPFADTWTESELAERWAQDPFLLLILKDTNLAEVARITHDAFVVNRQGRFLVLSNRPVIGQVVQWKIGINPPTFSRSGELAAAVRVPRATAESMARQLAPPGNTLTDVELCIHHRRLFYEFEFTGEDGISEIHVDAWTGTAGPDPLPDAPPTLPESALAALDQVPAHRAEQTAETLLPGVIIERELEVEDNVLCHAFHFVRNNQRYEILVTAAEGLPFKVSVEGPPFSSRPEAAWH